MISKLFFLIALIGFFKASAQPLIEVYLNINSPIKNGSNVESIEEKYELQIKEITSQPLRVTLSFDRNGNILSEKKFGKKDGLQSETTWEYNKLSKLTKKTHKYFINMKGWKLEETSLNYNDSGKLSEIKFIKDGELLNHCTVKNDREGRPTEVQVFDGKGGLVNIELIKYIPSANVIKVMVYKHTNQFVGNYNYPINNSLPFQNSSIKREYYPNGNIMLESLGTVDNSDQGYYYEYKYDGSGNWIEKTTYQATIGKNNKVKSKKPEHKITRTIKYY